MPIVININFIVFLSFVNHRKEVVERRTIYDLKVAEARAHILE